MAAGAPLRVGINGFGSIGRRVFRQAEGRAELDVVAVNDIADLPTLAHLLKYDSTYGTLQADVGAEQEALVVGGRRVRVSAERDPRSIPWREAGVDVVLEATGHWSDERAGAHLEAGARRVLVTAPAPGADVTLVVGVNHRAYDPARHRIVSGASCATQCLAVTCKALDDAFGLRRALCTTVHAYTNDQRLLDLPHRELRRARAACLSIIPTASGAAHAVEQALPHLGGRLGTSSFRVPVASVSVIDLVAELGRPVDGAEVNRALEDAAAAPPLRGLLGTSSAPLVSQDFRGDPRSAVVDLPLTQVVDGTLCKVVAWYDNEWGYSARLVDLLVHLATGGG